MIICQLYLDKAGGKYDLGTVPGLQRPQGSVPTAGPKGGFSQPWTFPPLSSTAGFQWRI